MAFSPKSSRILMAVYLAAVCFLCFGSFSGPDFDVPKSLFGIPVDKVVHFAMYLPFVPLFYHCFSAEKRGWIVLAAGFVLALAFGALIEQGQGLTTYRSCDAKDFLADGLGTLAGLVVTVIVVLCNRKRI